MAEQHDFLAGCFPVHGGWAEQARMAVGSVIDVIVNEPERRCYGRYAVLRVVNNFQLDAAFLGACFRFTIFLRVARVRTI